MKSWSFREFAEFFSNEALTFFAKRTRGDLYTRPAKLPCFILRYY